MRVLVPGGAGYIGSFTVKALQDAGHEVVVFDNLSFGHREAVKTEVVQADLADTAALDGCFERYGFDAVIHFAAFIEAGLSMQDAGRFFWNNTANAINLFNAMARHGVQRLVFSSTAAVYGTPQSVPVPEDAPKAPINVYGESKLLVERMLPWYEQVHGIRSVALRYFNASGAALDGSMGQDHQPPSHLMTVAILAALTDEKRFTLYGTDYPTPDGTCIRDYIHVLDLATAHVGALDYLVNGGSHLALNVGAGTGHSNRQVVDAVQRVSRIDLNIQPGPRRPGDPAELVADVSAIRERLGWQTEYSDLDTIAKSAWEWHSKHPRGYTS